MNFYTANTREMSPRYKEPPEPVDLPDDYCPECERPEWECECEQGNDQ
jgi:hypothetical protein